MTFSSLTNIVRRSPQHSSRNGTAVTSIILHHQASTNWQAVVQMMVTGSRQVSSNYVITNEGEVVGVVDEENRAWTSGSSQDGGKGAAWDRKSITFEIENSSMGGSWPVSPEAHEATARVVADVARRYRIRLSRDTTVVGHRELWTRHKASYPTACPGGLDMDWIVNRANAILASSGETPPPITNPTPPTGSSVNLGAAAGIAAWLGLQRMLAARYQYRGIIDGVPGPLTWAAMQRFLNANWGYTGPIDGIPGKFSWMATQRWLAARYGYRGLVDGVAGPLTYAALQRAGAANALAYKGQSAPAPSLPKTAIDGVPGPITWRRLQTYLKVNWGYEGVIDGVTGPMTWRAMQRFLKARYGYTGKIDGIPGKLTYSALQRLARSYGYTGPIDGVPGRNTWMGVQRFANTAV